VTGANTTTAPRDTASPIAILGLFIIERSLVLLLQHHRREKASARRAPKRRASAEATPLESKILSKNHCPVVFFTMPLPHACLNSSAEILPSPSTSVIWKLTMKGTA
jgi:hypothetical protein